MEGSAWSALGSGMNGVVTALAWDGTNLYAGGPFTTAGGVSANRIAQWNGSAWSALGSGTDNTVTALAWGGTNLYAGGTFTTAGGGSANYIAQWNGSAWSPLGSGMNDTVLALAWNGAGLYAGGQFTTAGLKPSLRIGLWQASPLAVTLADFYAGQVNDHVRVTWETASEIDNLGFNLYRGTSPDGWDRQLNELLIPSQSPGSPSGFVYTWDDYDELEPGTTYTYWLEDVDISGATDRHGPVSATFVAPTAVTVRDLDASGPTAYAIPGWAAVLALMAALGGLIAVQRAPRPG